MEGPFGAGFRAGELKVMRRGSRPSSLADMVKLGNSGSNPVYGGNE